MKTLLWRLYRKPLTSRYKVFGSVMLILGLLWFAAFFGKGLTWVAIMVGAAMLVQISVLVSRRDKESKEWT